MDADKFNLEPVKELAAGDDAFLKEMITIFLGQITEFIHNMNLFLKNGDMPNLAKEAHTAKSSVLIFGMEQTSSYLKKIQIFAENGDTENIPKLLKISETDLLDTSEKLKKIYQNLY